MMYLNKAVLSIFFLLLLVGIASAEVDISLSSTDLVGYTGEVQVVDITIKNNQEFTDSFLISIWPSQFAGVTAFPEKSFVTLSPGSKETIKGYFTIAMDAEEIVSVLTVSAKSVTNANVSDSENLYLRIIRKTTVYIKDIRLEKYSLDPGETVKIETEVINIANTPSEKYYLETTIKKSGEILKKFDDTLEAIAPKSTITLTKTFELGKYAEPGSYAIESILRDSLDKIVSLKSTNLNVNAVYKLPTEYTKKSTSYNFFFITTKVTVKNEGNVDTPSFYVTESIPVFIKTLFDPDIEPSIENVSGSRVIYSWLIPVLEPGKEITILYRFALWRVWLGASIIAGIVYFAFTFFYKPTLIKTYRHEGAITREKEITILLEVRNRTKHEIKDVEVRDFVPSIARLVERFDTLRPKVRTSQTGTELRWNFDSLKPKEERVLIYRIKPIVDVVGSLHLPNAHAKYSDKRMIKRMIVSKSLVVKPT